MVNVWLKAEYEFAALFSYRVPNLSPAYAPSAPMPGPSAVKLALVSTRIEHTGSVMEGTRMFEMVKAAEVGLQPSSRLVLSRVFIKRLKQMSQKSKGKGSRKWLGATYGTREYVHHSDPVALYIKVDSHNVDVVGDTLRKLRRIGTSDSLMTCLATSYEAPDVNLVARPLESIMNQIDLIRLGRYAVIPLVDIAADATFNMVNRYARSRADIKDFTVQRLYMFPLVLEGRGEGWRMFRRQSLELP